MIALLLLAQATAAVPALGMLDRQALPSRGCAAFLWSRADRRLVAMATGDPAGLRMAIDGRTVDLPRESQAGAGQFGLSDRAGYRAGDVVATLEMTIAARDDMTGGAVVSDGLLTLSRAAGDALVVPVAGLIGCRPTKDIETPRRSVR